MRIKKLDRRYSGFEFWTHRVEPRYNTNAQLRFFEQREFLSRSFGVGARVEECYQLRQAGRDIPKWGFDNDGNIFLRDEALTQFQLAMGRWD
jgi:hypothetical protein